MSSVNLERLFLNDGGTPSPHNSEKLSATSAPAVRPRWADISNNVIIAHTMRSLTTPAGIATVQNASRRRVTNGWQNEPRNCFPYPTAMGFSRYLNHSRRWHYRTHNWCMGYCFARCPRRCLRSPPTRGVSVHSSVSWPCYIAGARTCCTIPIFTAWYQPGDSHQMDLAGSAAVA